MTEYRRYQGKSYMVLMKDMDIKGYVYPMLLKNKITGLLPLQITSGDENVQFWYDISSRQALEDWMKIKKPGSGFLKKLLTALEETLEQTGEYLLSEDGISLAPDKIFLDAAEQEFRFCYMPFEKMDFAEELRRLMEYYISHMRHGGGSDTRRCYDVYEKCQQGHAAVEELLKLLFAKEEEKREFQIPESGLEAEDANTKEERENQSPEMPQRIKDERIKSARAIWNFLGVERWKTGIFREKRIKTARESYVFEPEIYQTEPKTQTVFLGSETEQIIGELRYEGNGNGQNLKITEPVYLIGSRPKETDGYIPDGAVSRIHAKITKEGGAYYLEDMNSTNGTSRNGEPLKYKEKVKLEKNDRISFADTLYRFV